MFKFAELKEKAAWLRVIKFINIIQLNQEITSIISPPYFLRSQNVGFCKQILISCSISSHKPEDGRLNFPIYKYETSGKIYLRKTFLQKIFNYFGTKMYMKNKLAYPEEGGKKYSETLPTNYKGTCLHIPEACKLH